MGRSQLEPIIVYVEPELKLALERQAKLGFRSLSAQCRLILHGKVPGTRPTDATASAP